MKKLKPDDAAKLYGKAETFWTLSPRDSRADVMAVLEKAAAAKRDVLIAEMKR